jgi:hypothetical protein
MRARPVAIDGVRIVGFEGESLVVEAPIAGRLLVPQEMIHDDSEIWRVGDAGTLLVEAAWAKQRGIKGKRQPRVAVAPVVGAPVELQRKARRSCVAPPPVEAPTLPEKKPKENAPRRKINIAKERWRCGVCGTENWHGTQCVACEAPHQKRPKKKPHKGRPLTLRQTVEAQVLAANPSLSKDNRREVVDHIVQVTLDQARRAKEGA